MRIATLKIIDRYEETLLRTLALSAELEQLLTGANDVMKHNANEGNLDGAIAAGLVTANHVQETWSQATHDFKQAAYDMTGENPHPGENDFEFIARLAKMRAQDLQALSLRNGVVWRA